MFCGGGGANCSIVVSPSSSGTSFLDKIGDFFKSIFGIKENTTPPVPLSGDATPPSSGHLPLAGEENTPVKTQIEIAGLTGNTGPQGPRGFTGLQGLKGDKGEPGSSFASPELLAQAGFVTKSFFDKQVDAIYNSSNKNLQSLSTSKQDALSGTGFVKISGSTISYDNSTYLTSLSGAVLTNQSTSQTIGLTGFRLSKLWATDLDVTNTITGSISGNAGTVTNGLYSSGSYSDPSWLTGLNATKLTTGTGAVTLTAGGTNQNVTLTPSGTGYTILNGNVGIGTTNPGVKLDVNGTIKIRDGELLLRSSTTTTGTHPILDVQNLRGTVLSPTYLLATDEVGALVFREGTSGTGMGGAGVVSNATEDWSATTLGSSLTFFTTPNGTTTKTNYLVVNNAGKSTYLNHVGIGITPTWSLDIVESGAKTIYDIGANISNISTSSTANKNKTGLAVSSTGTWDGTGSINRGLYVTATGGASNIAIYSDDGLNYFKGNTGFGTTIPSSPITIANAGGDNTKGIRFMSAAGTVLYGSIYYIPVGTGATDGFYVQAHREDAPLQLGTSAYPQTVTIKGGNVGIGISPSNILHVTGTPAAGTHVARIANTLNGTTQNNGLLILAGNDGGVAVSELITFKRPDNTTIGTITQTGAGAIAFNSGSDKRIKDEESIKPTIYGLSDLLNIKVDDFTFISDPNKQKMTGFIAQELNTIYPGAVTTNGDNGTDVLAQGQTPWMIDYSKLTPLLVKSVQELDLKVEGINNMGTENSLRSVLISWFGNVANGIQKLYTKEINTENLCVTDDSGEKVCITKQELLQIKTSAGIGATHSDSGSSGNTDNAENTDVCPNIDGVQIEIPAGDEINAEGNCVEKIVAPVVPAVVAPVAPIEEAPAIQAEVPAEQAPSEQAQ